MDTPFGLEWSQGHPNAFAYFSAVRRADEDQLPRHTEALLNAYINGAPAQSKSTTPQGFLSAPRFDKTHVRWTGPTVPQGSRSGGPRAGLI